MAAPPFGNGQQKTGQVFSRSLQHQLVVAGCCFRHPVSYVSLCRNPGNEQRPTLLKQSRELATAARRIDVYAGVDVFARDRPRLSYDAGPGCAKAVEEVAGCGLSVALFAPGWTLENGGGGGASPELIEEQFWETLRPSVASVKDSKG